MAILTADADRKRRAPTESEPAFLWSLLLAAGACLAVVGWTDVALLWYPLAFGNLEWEFATVGAHVMGMPLGTLGLVLFAAGAIGRGMRALMRGAAIFAGLVALSLVALAVLYALVVPVAWAGTAPEMQTVLVKALVKVVVYLTAYFALYGWMAWYVWRAARRSA